MAPFSWKEQHNIRIELFQGPFVLQSESMQFSSPPQQRFGRHSVGTTVLYQWFSYLR
jgi:hypothetical protein